MVILILGGFCLSSNTAKIKWRKGLFHTFLSTQSHSQTAKQQRRRQSASGSKMEKKELKRRLHAEQLHLCLEDLRQCQKLTRSGSRLNFQLMHSWNDFNKDKPSTSRYTTPPAQLVGKVALEYNKSEMMCSEREEKAAGHAILDEAIETVAVARNSGREEKGPSNKEHLKQRPLGQAAAGAAPANASDAFLKSCLELEMKRFQMDELRAKMDLRNAKLEETKLYGTIIAAPNLDAAARARVTMLFATATAKLVRRCIRGPGCWRPRRRWWPGPRWRNFEIFNLLPPGTVRQQALVSELLDCSAQQMRFFLGMNANSGHKSVEAMIIWVVNTIFTTHWTTSYDSKAASPKTVKGIPKFAAASRKTCINPHPCIRVEA